MSYCFTGFRLPNSLLSTTIILSTLMVCLLVGLGNGNETYVYLTKCNLGMRIKCMGSTQFENKKWESHSHGEVEDENMGMGMKHKFTFLSF